MEVTSEEIAPDIPALVACKRAMALAQTPVEKLQAIQRELPALAIPIRHGIVDRQIVVDEVHDACVSNAVFDDVGEDVVARVIERALDPDAAEPPTPSAEDYGADPDVSHVKQVTLPFVTFDTLTAAPIVKPSIIKGLLAKGETSGWIGAPGTGKSALLSSVSVSVASGQPWNGKPVRERGAVVYFALERGDLVCRRLQAQRQRDGLEGLPIAVVTRLINFMDRKTVDLIVATIRKVEKALGCPVVLIIIDTFAKAISAGGGDEDKARDQGAVFANLQRIKEACGVHIAIVGHTGKDENRGARGSNAILGDVDVMVTITGSGIRTATITKANDGPEGPIGSFQMQPVEVGVDEDGEPVSVAIVAPVETQQSSGDDEPKLTANQRTMFMILHAAGKAGLTTEQWNAQAHDAGIGIKRKADIYDFRAALKSKGLIRQFGDRWTVAQP